MDVQKVLSAPNRQGGLASGSWRPRYSYRSASPHTDATDPAARNGSLREERPSLYDFTELTILAVAVRQMPAIAACVGKECWGSPLGGRGNASCAVSSCRRCSSERRRIGGGLYRYRRINVFVWAWTAERNRHSLLELQMTWWIYGFLSGVGFRGSQFGEDPLAGTTGRR